MPQTNRYDLKGKVRYRVIETRMMLPSELLDHPGQWRDHTNLQADAMAGVLTEVGQIDSLKAWYSERAGGKLATWDGHLRKSLDPTLPWPVEITDLNDAEADYMLSVHDPIAAMAQTDKAAWAALQDTVQTSNAAVQQMLAGVLDLEHEMFGAPAPGEAQDTGAQTTRAAELQQAWGTRPGQIWQIGDQRLIVGDCRVPQTWVDVLAGERVQGVVTSPPYAEQRVKEYGGVPMHEYNNWWAAVQHNVAEHLAPDGSFFVNIKPHCADGERVLYVFDLVLAMARQWRWLLVDELCWLHIAMPGEWPNRFKNEFEPVYQFSRQAQIKFRPDNVKYQSPDAFSAGGGVGDGYGKGRLRKFRQDMTIGPGAALPSNVIIAQNEVSGATVHAAQFPVKLPAFFIQAYSDPNDLWCDPFCGGGTTLLAAQQQGRRGVGIEQKPEYAAVILDRLANSCGLEPELLRDA